MNASDQVYQLLDYGWWFFPASSTTKAGRHDIADILLKVALKHQKSNQNHVYNLSWNENTKKTKDIIN